MDDSDSDITRQVMRQATLPSLRRWRDQLRELLAGGLFTRLTEDEKASLRAVEDRVQEAIKWRTRQDEAEAQ